MAQAAYRLARLNAKSASLDQGGGKGELSPQDIAAALAFVKNLLGRELLCHMWWPDGARLTTRELDQQLVGVQFGEFRERMDVLVTAQIRRAIARNDNERRRADCAIEVAQAKMWPAINGTYDLIRKSVLRELVDLRICPGCQGRGHVSHDALKVVCQRCQGIGKTPRGPTWRAEQLDMKHSSYLEKWHEPYEWLFSHCMDEVQEAGRVFDAAVS